MITKTFARHLTIAIEEDVYQIIKTMSDRRKVSMGTVTRELLNEGLERIDYSNWESKEDGNYEWVQRS